METKKKNIEGKTDACKRNKSGHKRLCSVFKQRFLLISLMVLSLPNNGSCEIWYMSTNNILRLVVKPLQRMSNLYSSQFFVWTRPPLHMDEFVTPEMQRLLHRKNYCPSDHFSLYPLLLERTFCKSPVSHYDFDTFIVIFLPFPKWRVVRLSGFIFLQRFCMRFSFSFGEKALLLAANRLGICSCLPD